jgi:hypothetical protein
MRFRGAAVAAATLLALGAATPAPAQTADREKLALEMTHVLLQAVDFNALIAAGAEQSIGHSDFMKVRPEWTPLMLDALKEEVVADQPRIEAMMAHAMASSFTADELRAGIVVLNAPEMRGVIAAAVKHQAPPTLGNPPCSGDCMAALTSPAGQSFARKAGNLGTVLTPELQRQVTVAIVPGFMIRFGEKARAYDQAHPPQ